MSVCASVFDRAEHSFKDGITNSMSVTLSGPDVISF